MSGHCVRGLFLSYLVGGETSAASCYETLHIAKDFRKLRLRLRSDPRVFPQPLVRMEPATTLIEFVPMDSREADTSLLADTTTLQSLSTPAITKPLLTSRPATTAPLGQDAFAKPRAYQPWKRYQPTSAWEWQDKLAFWGSLGQASVAPDLGIPKRLGQRIRDSTLTQLKLIGSVARKFPSVVVLPLLLCGLLIGLGVFGVRTAADNEEDSIRSDAEAAALKVSTSLSLILDRSIVPVFTLATLIRRNPALKVLQPLFYNVTPELLDQGPPQAGPSGAAFQLELVPFGIVRAIFPPRADLDSMDVSLFSDPTRREEAIRTVERKTVWLAGPMSVTPNHTVVLIARNPVFISGVGPNETWGNTVEAAEGNANCSACYDPASGTKFWGFAASYIDLAKLIGRADSPLALLTASKYRYSLVKPGGAPGDPSARLAQSPSAPPSGGSVRVAVPVPGDSSWQLDVYLPGGFRPSWEGPMIAVVVVFSMLLAAVVFVALLNRCRLTMLLRDRLPERALRTLRFGQPFFDYFPTVTVLDCQVVRYTSQEGGGGVPPLEVMKLLNEVYAIFDCIVERHKLHKVETYGDSYVAVGGCPEAGGRDPITWAAEVAHCARDLVVAAAKYRSSYGQRIQIQIGLHSGPAMAGVIDGGKRLPRYCLFGDTRAMASELCAASQPQAIHVSRTAVDLLADAGDPMIMLIPRGLTSFPGRQPLFTSWLQVDLMAGAYGGAYGGRKASTDLLARHRDDDEVSLDGFNIARKTLPRGGDDSDGEGEDIEGGRVHSLFGSFSRRLEPDSWRVVCDVMGVETQVPGGGEEEREGEEGEVDGEAAQPGGSGGGDASPQGSTPAVVARVPTPATAPAVLLPASSSAAAAAAAPLQTQPRLPSGAATASASRHGSGSVGAYARFPIPPPPDMTPVATRSPVQQGVLPPASTAPATLTGAPPLHHPQPPHQPHHHLQHASLPQPSPLSLQPPQPPTSQQTAPPWQGLAQHPAHGPPPGSQAALTPSPAAMMTPAAGVQSPGVAAGTAALATGAYTTTGGAGSGGGGISAEEPSSGAQGPLGSSGPWMDSGGIQVGLATAARTGAGGTGGNSFGAAAGPVGMAPMGGGSGGGAGGGGGSGLRTAGPAAVAGVGPDDRGGGGSAAGVDLL